MWAENIQINNGLNAMLTGNIHPVVNCCDKPEVHTFIHDFEGQGSAWIWCSACKSYAHAGRIDLPNKWVNCAALDDDEICVEPDYLEDNKTAIDKHMSKW